MPSKIKILWYAATGIFWILSSLPIMANLLETRTPSECSTIVTGGLWHNAEIISGSQTAAPALAVNCNNQILIAWQQTSPSGHSIYARYFDGTMWAASTKISGNNDATNVRVAWNCSGAALAVWQENSQIYYGYFNGISWTAPQQIPGSGNDALSPVIAFDCFGNAIALWSQLDGSVRRIYGAYFNGSSWSGSIIISGNLHVGDASNVKGAFDCNGNAIAVWQQHASANPSSSTSIYGAFFNGSSWSLFLNNPISGTTAIDPQITFDCTGQARACWLQTVTPLPAEVYVALYDKTSWQEPFSISHGISGTARSPQIVIDCSGKPIVTWENFNGAANYSEIYVSNLIVPVTISNPILNTSSFRTNPQIAADCYGNAFVTWIQDNAIYYSYFDKARSKVSFGLGWQASKKIPNSSIDVSSANQTISSQLAIICSGNAVVTWPNAGTGTQIALSFYNAVPSPTTITATQHLDNFDLINTLSWDPITNYDAPIISYCISCTCCVSTPAGCCASCCCVPRCCQCPCTNSEPLAEIPNAGSPITFDHHCRCPGVTYNYCIRGIAQINNQLILSPVPKFISVTPTVINVPAPSNVQTSQHLNGFDLINVLQWDNVTETGTTIKAYNIYCNNYEEDPYLCQPENVCQPTCPGCPHATFIQQVPAPESPQYLVTMEHHCRCPGKIYHYCIASVDIHDNISPIPAHATVEPTVPAIPSPGPITTSQYRDNFNLINRLTWEPVTIPGSTVTGYNIYCSQSPDEYDCYTCENCQPNCCAAGCQHVQLIGTISQPTHGKVIFDHPCRCAGVDYRYCVTSIVDNTYESPIPTSLVVPATVPDIPAPSSISSSQHLDDFNLVNTLTWDSVTLPGHTITAYKIYCSTQTPDPSECDTCNDCYPVCCSFECSHAKLIATIPAPGSGQVTFDHNCRCAGVTYRYCITSVADNIHESVTPTSVKVTPTVEPIPAPKPINHKQEVEHNFDVINVLTWPQVTTSPTTIIAYRVYCSSLAAPTFDCFTCQNCQPICCSPLCSKTHLIAEIPAPTNPADLVIFRHKCRCAGSTYVYCVTAVDYAGNESPHPTTVAVIPTVPNIPSPDPVNAFTHLDKFDLINTLSWSHLSFNPSIVAYNVYCTSAQNSPDDCQECYDCYPICCQDACIKAEFLAQVPAPSSPGSQVTFDHHCRCPETIYRYCVASVDAQNNISTNPTSVTTEPYPVIPAPDHIDSYQSLQKFDLINNLLWMNVEDPYHKIIKYRIYCASSIERASRTCFECQPYCLPSSCSQSTLIAEVDAPASPTDLITFAHHCRCPGITYDYCVSSVDDQGHESITPAQVTVEPSIDDVPAPTNPEVTQTIENNILVDTITFEPSSDPYVIKYNIYCTIQPVNCDFCQNCVPTCCTDCMNATLIGSVPSTGPYIFVHPYRCPHIAYKYCISSVDNEGNESIIPATTVVKPIEPTAPCQDLIPNTLTSIQEICHGAPVRSVAWLCDQCPAPLHCSCTDNFILPRPIAAIGGFISHTVHTEGSSLQIYEMDLLTEQLHETAHATPTNYVLSVNWCCIDNVPYLAVGGSPDLTTGDDTWIYKYDIASHNLTLVASFRHGAQVNAVSWLCTGCTQPGIVYLALGGKESNGINIRILRFDVHCKELSLITSRSFGANVLALDWCMLDENTPLLLVGGKTAVSDAFQHYNIAIYCSNCTGILNRAGIFYYKGGTVRTAKWCCNPQRTCTQPPVFAVGGNDIDHDKNKSSGVNIELFVYNPLCNQVKSLACQYLPKKVFALDWVPDCHCTLLTAGSGCLHDCMCQENIAILQILAGRCSRLRFTTLARYDDTISSLAWCSFGQCSYLLVGTEHKTSECPTEQTMCDNRCEVALYKAHFCTQQQLPEGICDRRTLTWTDKE